LEIVVAEASLVSVHLYKEDAEIASFKFNLDFQETERNDPEGLLADVTAADFRP
jgi:hypothetical protein